MIKLTKGEFIDSERYLEDLTKLGFIYVDLEILSDRLEKMEPLVATRKHLCSEVMSAKTGHRLYTLNDRNVLLFLKDFEGCPTSAFRVKGRKGDSLDAKKVIKPLMDRGYATEFLEMYVKYTSSKAIFERLRKLSQRLQESEEESYSGKKLYELKFNYSRISNLRLSTVNDNVQGTPKIAVDCFVAPKGYVLVSGDFKQADLRWAYSLMVKTKENLPIMMKYDDKYEALARILQGDEFNLEEFKENRDIYKQNSLAPIYGAKSGKTGIETKFIQQANRMLSKSPNYVEYLRRINRRMDLKLPLKVTSYFGHSEVINTTGIVPSYDKDPLNFALNSPIQTGTSEIVKAVTNSIMDDFKSLGYTSENKSIYSYLNRHDEALFLVKYELLEYSHIFQKHQIVQVDNCIPFEIEFQFTRQYNTDDEGIDRVAKSYFREEFNERPLMDYDNTDFYIPTKNLFELCIGTFYIEETKETVIAFLDTLKNKCTFETIKEATPDMIIDSIVFRASRAKEVMESNDCDCVLIYTKLADVETTIFKGYSIRLSGNYSHSMAMKADIMAEFGAYSLLRDKGIQMKLSASAEGSIEWARQVIRNGSAL